jgi:DNA-binding beta-propeller fold protein YncE
MLDRREFLVLGAAAAAPVLLGRPARSAAGPLALATADTEAHVAVVSLASMRLVQRLATAGDPRSIESGRGGRVVVTHASAGAISLLEGRPLQVRRVLRGFGAPRYAAIRPDGTLAYVTDSAHGEIAVVDLVAGRVLRRVEVGAGARHLTLHPDGRHLWVALGSSAAEIADLDLRDRTRPRVVARVRPPFLAHDVAFSSGRRVWITAGREPRIALIDTADQRAVRVLHADAAPQHVSFGHGVAYVASGDGASVRVHELMHGRVRRTARVPYGSYNIQAGAGAVVTASLARGMLTILDRAGRVQREVRVAPAAHDACLLR